MIDFTTARNLICLVLLITGNVFAQTDSTTVSDTQIDSSQSKFNIPIFSTSGGDVDTDLEQQDVSALLQSSRDVFTQFSSFQFGVGRYRMRGYLAENQLIMINGVNVNNIETGFSSWSNWGGLNDVTRFVETRFGNVASRYG
ncbi:MAG: TonB-dependent receptor plug domain-containing protein, partial [Bacteroidota bacterium]|nr:TonB-dependent receptor plug domain-containing protein [Bacteroidota bacterium]